ncbi:hypothetical protein [Mesorhizobium sp. f-mel]
MSKATYPLKLPLSIKEAAARLAKADGVSLNQWIASAVAQKVGAMETAADFLRRRAGDASGVISLKCSIASASNRRNPATRLRLTSTDQGRFFCQSLAVSL